MKVTNKLHLPAAFVNAVSVRRHNEPGCFSATTLNKGAKEIILSDRHFDEIEVDAADSVWIDAENCADYCLCRDFCNFYRQEQEAAR